VPGLLVKSLRKLGEDVLTALEAGRANQEIRDTEVLAYANQLGRAGLTNDRWHFHRMHTRNPAHAGIITFTDDPDTEALATRIHDAGRNRLG
jgi:hypothetical protein